ncbi:hypothetical protein H4Q32_027502 [Labeo rohita]|uniref:CxC3 like cysteine cluster domain-containing protein n=1 Tax=Labeo rohita TaxID=84645 RepID=A0ABQ8L2N5_LABRO|nr:hypothetical protein H4Q32_027502 [Labeo rohita]
MAALISDAYLHDARAAMAKKNPAFPQRKTRKSRKRSLTNPLVTGRCEKRRETHCPGSGLSKRTVSAAASQSRRRDPVHEEGLQIEDQELASLGRYDVCLPRKSCSSCSAEWIPKVKDLLIYRYWPASTSCQTLYKFDVFTSFEHMKVTAPAMSRQALLKMLEHRSVQAGRLNLPEYH